MKKKVEVTIPAKEEVKYKEERTYCDVSGCGDRIATGQYGWGKKLGKCFICDRDICKMHTVDDPDDSGDYPDRWCTICNALYLYRRRQMQQRHWQEEDDLLKEVRQQSLAHG